MGVKKVETEKYYSDLCRRISQAGGRVVECLLDDKDEKGPYDDLDEPGGRDHTHRPLKRLSARFRR